jgi:hypothetical protein
MAKLDLSGLDALHFSDQGKIRFTAKDRIRGDVEVTLSDPEDVLKLAQFLMTTVAVWSGNATPEDAGYGRMPD